MSSNCLPKVYIIQNIQVGSNEAKSKKFSEGGCLIQIGECSKSVKVEFFDCYNV